MSLSIGMYITDSLESNGKLSIIGHRKSCFPTGGAILLAPAGDGVVEVRVGLCVVGGVTIVLYDVVLRDLAALIVVLGQHGPPMHY